MQRARGELATSAVMRGIMKDKFDISPEQVAQIFEKYGWGKVAGFEQITGNYHNTVIEVRVSDDRDAFLKVQHRSCTTQSLRADAWVVDLLRSKSDLPVIDTCVLDESEDIMPHPFMLTKKMDGVNGLTFFEGTENQPYRIELAKQFGYVMGLIHTLSVDPPDFLRPLFLNDWRKVVDLLLADDFRDELEAFSQKHVADLCKLLDGLQAIAIEESPYLIWGDPAFHNLLVDVVDGQVQILCVVDFEASGYGNRLFDLHRGRSNVKRRNPPEVYGDPNLIPAFEDGYCSAGLRLETHLELEMILWEVHFCARGMRWAWDNFGILPRQTPELFDRLLIALPKLKEMRA